jgi:hypothetical protein
MLRIENKKRIRNENICKTRDILLFLLQNVFLKNYFLELNFENLKKKSKSMVLTNYQ